MQLLNVVVSALLEGHSHRHDVVTNNDNAPKEHKVTRKEVDKLAEDLNCTPPCITKDPVSQLDTVQKIAIVLEHEQELQERQGDDLALDTNDDFVDTLPLPDTHSCGERTHPATVDDVEQSPAEIESSRVEKENKRLAKMGMTTALAVALHNFPEGLATFVAALNDPKVGAVLAIAIAVHNIPEGLCIAPPIYYATGNRTKAFLWALLSGAAELVAAFLGWLVLSNVVTDAMYGSLFGLVAGMMVIISIRELLPTAHFYDPEDTIVTYSFIGGTMFMALSLVLFVI